MSKFVRVNLTVLKELKAQMGMIGRRVNWSAVAADAFRKKVKKVLEASVEPAKASDGADHARSEEVAQ